MAESPVMQHARWSAAPRAPTSGVSVKPPTCGFDFGDDVQGIVWSGYGRLTDAVFLLVDIVDAEAARTWLGTAPVTTVLASESRPTTALQIAFTRQGLDALELDASVIAQFSSDFIAGMAADEDRSRRLGDVGTNGPLSWYWGGTPAGVPHIVVMLYALPGELSRWEDAVKSGVWDTAFRVQRRLDTSSTDNPEPFGFADGISQPRLDWHRDLEVKRKMELEFSN